ncbi:MAG: hypothetical protein ACTSPG_09475 [Candidatus Hodarchaeales archaeon]
MVLIPELAPFVPIINLAFFVVATPFVLWLNNKTRNDILCLVLGIAYVGLYGFVFQPPWDEWLFFFFGLIVGYVTDYWGVKSKKWKYHPWDPDFGYSYYVGFSWGMVAIFTYNISKAVTAEPNDLFLPGILFVLPMIFFEWKYGETRRDQYFLFARAIFTFLAFFVSGYLGLLFVAIFVGSWIEFAGVNWIKNWLYIDTMSYIFLSFGYSMIIFTAKLIVDLITQELNILGLILFAFAVAFYAIDTFWAQKHVEVDDTKAIKAANDYNERYNANR